MKKFGLKMGMVAAAFLAMAMMMSCRVSVNGGDMSGGDVSYSASDLKPKAFKKIDVEVVADVFYTQNNGDKCEVRLDFSDIKDEKMAQELKEKVKVLYRKDAVEIVLDGKVRGATKLGSGNRLKIYITSPDIVVIDMSGVGVFHADTINTDTITIDNEGVGSINVKSLLANKCDIDNEGVGSVKMENVKADRMTIDNEGVGSVKIAQFDGGKVYITNEGVGSVKMNVNCDYVRATLEGVGGIHLSGVTHRLDEDKDGIGSVKKKDLQIIK